MLRNIMKIFFGLAVMLSVAFPSYADWSVGVSIGDNDRFHHDHGYYGWHDHPHWGWHEHYLPPDCYTVWAGGIRYSYCGGLYYTYVGAGDYVVVNPPIGAYVAAIPPDFQAVIINGRTYYTSEGVYYILTLHHGYKVVPAPVVYSTPAPVVVSGPPVVTTTVVTAPAPVPSQDDFTINVPNNSGGYTAVIIKRSGNGYVGPQGEFYASFPSVAQLKAMYGK